jgi:hypothetical protein
MNPLSPPWHPSIAPTMDEEIGTFRHDGRTAAPPGTPG